MREAHAFGIAMTDWLALLLLFATYALTFVVSGSRSPKRARRPQFDPILPTPKRAQLRLLRGALGSSPVSLEGDWMGDRHAS